MRPASATGKSACSSFCAVSRAALPYTAAAARCTPLVPGDWEMDRPFLPYELDVAIRDSLLGSAPGPGDMLNEFLHRLGPVARGTLRTMIHNSLANGSLPGSWKMGDAIPIPTREGSMPPRESQTYHAALCFTKVNRKNDSPPSVSVIAAPPT
ncbi:hypothetical protein C3747_62g209 [Trypanosoma cruzi]|uniref:Uncharacterized protein n=1 Tax=Trypanosoma cruzi TaxID=5693 RepID=A0A2V2WRP9_TRYCR|nr:hypothetical protein C3747_62g209 [Trypanosoma cruzi]